MLQRKKANFLLTYITSKGRHGAPLYLYLFTSLGQSPFQLTLIRDNLMRQWSPHELQQCFQKNPPRTRFASQSKHNLDEPNQKHNL